MKKTSKFIALLIVLAMAISLVPLRVLADGEGQNQQNNQPYTFTFTASGNHTVQLNDGHLEIDGTIVEVRDGNNSNIGQAKYENGVFKIEVSSGVPGELNYGGNDFTLYMQGHPYQMGTVLSANEDFLVQDYVSNNNQGGGHVTTGNTTATVTVSGGTGSYTKTVFDEQQGKQVEIQEPYSQSYVESRIRINESDIEIPFEEQTPESYTDTNFRYDYSANDYSGTANEGKVRISFGSLFLFKYDGSVKVNNEVFNVSEYINYSNRDNWLDHYDHQMTSFDVYVNKADSYNIVVNISEVDENTCFIGNFLWTADADQQYVKFFNPDTNQEEYEIDEHTGEKRINDDYIGNAKIKLMKIVYQRNGQTVTRDFTKQSDLDAMDQGESETGPNVYYHNYSDGDIEYGYKTRVDYDDGSLVVPEGAIVTMKIVPNYGYQVTEFSINGGNIITGDNISEFSFEIGKGNFHLGAKVEKVENTVKLSSKGVSDGGIVIGNNEIDSGSVRLSVSDSEPSQEKIAEFEKNVAEGYEINDYLNISLDQVFYKASADDVWAIEKEDLNDDATVSLKLEEGIDPNNTVILHNIHDGDEFEEVEFEYDANTKTLQFKTKSFSNYAIATKKTEQQNDDAEDKTEENDKDDNGSVNAENKENSPQTGDTIGNVFIVLAVAMGALLITFKFKKGKTSKH